MDGEEEGWRKLWSRNGGLRAALRSRRRGRTRSLSRVQRVGQRCERQGDRDLAMSKTTVGAADCRKREHRRHRLADTARIGGGAAGGEAGSGIEGERRATGHRRRSGVYWRDQRSSLPRLRI